MFEYEVCKTKMRLVIDLTSLCDHLTGIERFASNLSYCLINAHPENTYILLFKNEIYKDFQGISTFSNVECHVLRCRSRILFNQLILPLKLYRIRADIYFFPAFCAPWLFFSRHIVDTIHDMSDFECYEGKAPLKVLYSRLGILHAKHCSRHIVTVSEFSKGRIAEILGISRDKISVIPNGVSKKFIQSEQEDGICFRRIAEKYHLPSRYLLSVSTLEPRKNLKLLIEAYFQIRDEFQDLHLVLCGRAGWNLSEVLGKRVMSSLGEKPSNSRDDKISDRIHITGFVQDEDLPYIYKNAEWFVFPSKYEGFGIPPLEAMGMGCPVLSSDAASLPEVLGGAAVYFSNNSLDSITQTLRRCVRMPVEERRKRIREGSFRSLKFAWENSANSLNSIINTLIPEKGR